MTPGGARRLARTEMHAVLAPPGALLADSTVALQDEEAHHLRVRRAREGEEVRVLDGAGKLAEGRLVRGRDGLGVAIGAVREAPPPPAFTLIVGAGDRERFGWLAEKASELGVTDLVPLETAWTRSVGGRVREAHVPALQRRAREAIKQSRAAWAPTVHPPEGVNAAARRGAGSERWLADARAEPPGAIPAAGALTVVVGPEGGLTEAERALFLTTGFKPVRLAPGLLRFETAALAAAAVIASQRPRRDYE